HEVLRVLPIGRAELPERIADRVEPGDRHVDRAESAVRGPVPRAQGLRAQSRQRLRLAASGEEGELRGIGRPDPREPRGEEIERLVPLYLDELAGAALAARLAQEGVL